MTALAFSGKTNILDLYRMIECGPNWAILAGFGDPEETFGDPKKGRDPQFENR